MTTLSICIPTYNRAELLAYCLENLRALDGFGLDYEIVIVDHASPDHTQEVVEKAAAERGNIRYYKQAHQVGIERQLASCLGMARGKFCVYVADDDKIIPEKLVEYVRYLEAHPEVSVVYAPWWAYDDAESKIIHGYFQVPQRMTFVATQPLAMVDFMTARMVFPESAIYRSEALHAILSSRRDGPYQSFLMATALLRLGHVVFETSPFYLEVAVTKPQFAPPQRMNVEINLTYLDNIRSSMEIMIERMILQLGGVQLPQEMRASVHEALLNYNLNRVSVAFRRALAARQFVQASELAQRIMHWQGVFHPDLPQISHDIYVLTGLQAVAHTAGGKSWLKQLYLHGFVAPDKAIEVLRQDLPELPIAGATREAILAHGEPDYVMVLVKEPADRAPFLDGRLPPGNVVALKNLADYYQIIPAVRTFETL